MTNTDSYTSMPSDELAAQMKKITDSWELYFAGMLEKMEAEKVPGLDNIHVTKNSKALRELVVRVDQRKDYFTRYHSGLHMSEFKEIGLNMFWLTKLKPFSVEALEENIDKFTYDVNEDFALHHMFSALENMAADLRTPFDMERLPQSLYYEMSYCMSFRDMSKEALGMLVELVARIVMPDYYLVERMLESKQTTD